MELGLGTRGQRAAALLYISLERWPSTLNMGFASIGATGAGKQAGCQCSYIYIYIHTCYARTKSDIIQADFRQALAAGVRSKLSGIRLAVPGVDVKRSTRHQET